MIPAATLWAYHATTFAVAAPDGTTATLRPGAHSPDADALLRRLGARSLCCLNAWNPRSRTLPAQRNMAAHRRLQADLQRRGYRGLPYLGVPDRHGWRAEPGFAVPDLDTGLAIRLAETYGQYGILQYPGGGTAELILTRLARRSR